MIPKWLSTTVENSPPPSSLSEASTKSSFVDRTLNSITSLLKEAVFSEDFAAKRGLLQRLDPRVKLVTFLFLIVSLSFARNAEILWVVYLLSLLMASFSLINIGFFVKRVWLFIPIFSGIIAVPAIFSFITPGESLLTFFRLNYTYTIGPWTIPSEIAITRPGLDGAILFVSRVAVSVSLVVLMTLTTKWADLLKALRSLYVPQVLVLVLGMTYRYIFLLLTVIQNMYLAKKSRTIRPLQVKTEQRWVAGRIGTIFRRSYDLSNDVYFAMVSRGFRGEAKSLNTFSIRKFDVVWSAGIFFLCIIILRFNIFLK